MDQDSGEITPRVALVAATPRELGSLKVCLSETQNQDCLTHGIYHGLPVSLIQTGVGNARVRRSLEEALEWITPTRILLVGICGALNPNLKTGDSLIPSRICADRGDLSLPVAFDDWRDLLSLQQLGNQTIYCEGEHLSADKMLSAEEKASCLKRYPEAQAVDMESIEFARICRGRKIPFAILKTVADSSDYTLPPDANLQALYQPGEVESKNLQDLAKQVDQAIEINTRLILAWLEKIANAPGLL